MLTNPHHPLTHQLPYFIHGPPPPPLLQAPLPLLPQLPWRPMTTTKEWKQGPNDGWTSFRPQVSFFLVSLCFFLLISFALGLFNLYQQYPPRETPQPNPTPHVMPLLRAPTRRVCMTMGTSRRQGNDETTNNAEMPGTDADGPKRCLSSFGP